MYSGILMYLMINQEGQIEKVSSSNFVPSNNPWMPMFHNKTQSPCLLQKGLECLT